MDPPHGRMGIPGAPTQKKQSKNKLKNEKQKYCAILISGCSSHSACRAAHFWPSFSLREHQEALLGSKAKTPENIHRVMVQVEGKPDVPFEIAGLVQQRPVCFQKQFVVCR
jgi:hypothetical protein